MAPSRTGGLIVEGLHVGYGRSTVLHGVDLQVDPGRQVALLGPNGAGKSTLLRAISGMLRPRSGDIRFAGRSLTGCSPDEIVRQSIVHVPEGRHIFPDFTVAENLRVAGYVRRGRGLVEDIDRVLAAFPALQKRLSLRAGFLSGGEQQMLAIGRAVIQKPQLLLVDEMSLGLAPIVVKDIYATLSGLFGDTSTLIVEQNPRLALRHCQDAYFIRNGAIFASGPATAFVDDKALANAYMGSSSSTAGAGVIDTQHADRPKDLETPEKGIGLPASPLDG